VIIILSLAAQPTFITTPRSKSVGVGRKASFNCEVTGHPVPAVFWKRSNGAVSQSFTNVVNNFKQINNGNRFNKNYNNK